MGWSLDSFDSEVLHLKSVKSFFCRNDGPSLDDQRT